jgi:pimeloyl-ACP methyl ester carboxylesterase
MSTYVLVHGAWYGAWSWYRIIPLLEKQGHKVIIPDLPGHGIDHSVPQSSAPLRSYVDHIKNVVQAQSEPVILVGHSLGGQTITQVAEEISESIEKLVYLAAYLLPSGISVLQAHQNDIVKASQPNDLLRLDEASGLYSLNDARFDLLNHGCNDADIALSRILLTAEPIPVLLTPVQTSERFASVRRFYIETREDQIVPLALQRQMYTKLPCEHVFSLATGHLPLFSTPESLAEILVSVATYPNKMPLSS